MSAKGRYGCTIHHGVGLLYSLPKVHYIGLCFTKGRSMYIYALPRMGYLYLIPRVCLSVYMLRCKLYELV